MKRVAMTDASGKWFDIEKAEEFKEGTTWNGSNNISDATGSQWAHETLYRTASGKWVLNCWSQVQGKMETWEIIDDDDAAKWLVKNGHDSDIVAQQIADLEI